MRVLVIGGGAIGAAVALFLKRGGGSGVDVQVVEQDLSLRQSSSALSAGSIRQQFSNAVNVQMSRFGHQLLAEADAWLGVDGEPVHLGHVPGAYLFCATGAAGAGVLRANQAVQQAAGAQVALLSPAQAAARFAWLRSDDLALASLGGAGEGWFDGEAWARALGRKARALGAGWLHARVVGFDRYADRITAARLADGQRIEADVFVNAAGPWAGALGRLAGLPVPVQARRRTVFAMRCPHPDCANFWLCNGFSGHGLQHAPAAGRGVAEHLLTGAWQTLDLSAFSPQRVVDGRPFVEQAII